MNAEALFNSSLTAMQQFTNQLHNAGSLPPGERRLLNLTIHELAELPEITSDHDAAHFMAQLQDMNGRITDYTKLEPIAMTYALALRVAEFVIAAGEADQTSEQSTDQNKSRQDQ